MTDRKTIEACAKVCEDEAKGLLSIIGLPVCESAIIQRDRAKQWTQAAEAIRALAASPEQGAQEAVAWMYTNSDTGAEVITRQPPDRVTPAYLTTYNVQPLYAAPAAPGMVLVPVEPTPEMWDAAWKSIGLPYRAKLSMHEIKTLFDLFHKAMLTAAKEK